MLAKRIITCLDVKEGRTVKGVHFNDLKDAGDIVELAKKYSVAGADELVFLDITASNDNRSTRLSGACGYCSRCPFYCRRRHYPGGRC